MTSFYHFNIIQLYIFPKFFNFVYITFKQNILHHSTEYPLDSETYYTLPFLQILILKNTNRRFKKRNYLLLSNLWSNRVLSQKEVKFS